MTANAQFHHDVARPRAGRRTGPLGLALSLAASVWLSLSVVPAGAQDPAQDPAPAPPVKAKVEAMIPEFEAMLEKGMADFAVPGAAVGIVVGDEVVYAKGFGVRADGGDKVDTGTLFQIGSATKAFLAATLAMMVDDKKLTWSERVVGVYPNFVLHDPWVTREFRIFDLLAQRSGLRPYVNDQLAFLGYGADTLIHSLRFAEPVTSFRSTFGYVNILHLMTGRIVANAAGKSDWFEVAKERILDPLGMTRTNASAEAIEADANHATGHRWTGDAAVAIPFSDVFPYALGPAGNLNSSVDDMTKWVRMLVGNGSFEGKPILDEQALGTLWTPKVAINDQQSYATGWVIQELPKGRVVWHNGGTSGFGAHVGLIPEDGVGIVILSNIENRGFADLSAMWFYRHVLGEPPLDQMGAVLERARARLQETKASFTRPAEPRPAPVLADLAGGYDTQEFGPAEIRVDGERLVLRLNETEAELALEPFDGDVFTVRLLPNGRFADAVAMNGDQPMGFAQFLMEQDGRLSSLRLILDDQPYLMDKVED